MPIRRTMRNTILVIAAILIIGMLAYNAVMLNKLRPHMPDTEITVDTLVVTNVVTETVFRDKIIAVPETVLVDNTMHTEVELDTLVTTNSTEVHTNVKYTLPESYWTFNQSITSSIDTVYINTLKKETMVVTKQNWTMAAIGTIAGIITGILITK